MFRIMYTRPHDGGVSIVHAASKESVKSVLGELTDEQYRAHVWERSIPADAINAIEIDESTQLPDREFRDAWKQDGKSVAHDLEKARQIQLERIRKAREPKLLELDKEFILKIEKAEPTVEVVSKKQALRDITEPLKKAILTSIDDVKRAFPKELSNV